MKLNWKIKAAIAAVLIIGAAVYGYQYYQGQQAAKKAAAVETVPVTRMHVKSTVSATGTIKPVNSVEVFAILFSNALASPIASLITLPMPSPTSAFFAMAPKPEAYFCPLLLPAW